MTTATTKTSLHYRSFMILVLLYLIEVAYGLPKGGGGGGSGGHASSGGSSSSGGKSSSSSSSKGSGSKSTSKGGGSSRPIVTYGSGSSRYCVDQSTGKVVQCPQNKKTMIIVAVVCSIIGAVLIGLLLLWWFKKGKRANWSEKLPWKKRNRGIKATGVGAPSENAPSSANYNRLDNVSEHDETPYSLSNYQANPSMTQVHAEPPHGGNQDSYPTTHIYTNDSTLRPPSSPAAGWQAHDPYGPSDVSKPLSMPMPNPHPEH